MSNTHFCLAPADFTRLTAEFVREDLQGYTVVRLARRAGPAYEAE